MNKKCLGCGILLQSENEHVKGYIPKDKYEKGYCQRCFRLTNYHEILKETTNIDNEKIINSLNAQVGLKVFVCDLANFNQETFNYYQKIKNPKIFVISKVDLFISNISVFKLINWLRGVVKIKEDIIYVSNLKKNSLKTLLNYLNNCKEKHLYFVGISNVGKSSLINQLFDTKLTTSEMPNTTLDYISFKYLDKTIYDTVGLTYQTPNLPVQNFKSPFKQINMPLKAMASIYIPDLFRIKTLETNNIVCYFPKYLKPIKIYDNDNTFLDKEKITIKVDDNTIIFIKAIGFLYLKKQANLEIYNVVKNQISIMKSFFGGEENGQN